MAVAVGMCVNDNSGSNWQVRWGGQLRQRQ